MKNKLAFLLTMSLLTIGCQKKPDAPAPAVAPVVITDPPQPPPPPPVTNCQGATILYSLPGIQTVADNSSKDFVIPNFEISCGDSLTVFLRKNSGQAWFQLGDINNGASYYSLNNQTVTVHNRTGIVQEVDIEAVLK